MRWFGGEGAHQSGHEAVDGPDHLGVGATHAGGDRSLQGSVGHMDIFI